MQNKLTLGSIMALIGAAGLILGPVIGLAALGRPWSFIAGFVVGIIGGLGVALSVAGLIERRGGN
ncbi:MAG: hypothetical protein JSU61_08900 [Fidelibacterota bacterium]|nr:MAG: hypothetical protein JSU61_08900 [Candidatus Neomarinimicrobiota bacterium]